MNQTAWERSPLSQKLIVDLVKKGSAGLGEIVYLPETSSTNQRAKELVDAGKTSFAVITDFQSAGKGRLDRIWEAPKESSILISIVESLNGVSNLGWLNLWAATIARRVLLENFLFEIKLKWPNDLVVPDGDSFLKFGGILSQIHQDNAIFGIGINFSQDRDELPISSATSLKLLNVQYRQREEVISDLISTFHLNWQSEAASSEFPTAATVREYQAASHSLAKEVSVSLPSGELISGIAEGLAANGALLVKTKSGEIHTITAGDVS
jgi:BirA family transcriptional regulator, biotin operon repressor / biotin---[acetyl-CoA-carboxylase] ligase